MRIILSTCWLVGAGGGWTLALAGLSAGARGANGLVDLVIIGGAASWIGMLWTALRPGRSPNLWQKSLAAASWLMPITMLILRDEFSVNFILLSIASAACVTMIVVIYPSQSYTPPLEVDRRLEVHLVKVAAAAKKREAVGGDAGSGEAERSGFPGASTSFLGAVGEVDQAEALAAESSLREALLSEGVPESVLESAFKRLGEQSSGTTAGSAVAHSAAPPESEEASIETSMPENVEEGSGEQSGVAIYSSGSGNPNQAAAPRPELVTVKRTRKRSEDDVSRWAHVEPKRWRKLSSFHRQPPGEGS